MYDKDNIEIKRDMVSYYTLAATAIPYEDRIRLDEEEAKKIGEEFDTEICGISAIGIRWGRSSCISVDNEKHYRFCIFFIR